MKNYTVSQLIAFIESHGHRAIADIPGYLIAMSDVRLPSGEVVEEAEQIPATLRDVRFWLGY